MTTLTQSIAAAAISLAALSGVAHAGEATPPEQQVLQAFESKRTVAEVRAEAAVAVKNRDMNPAGSRVMVFNQTGADRASVRAATVEAVRIGAVARGELSL
jgi:hypothetical protein